MSVHPHPDLAGNAEVREQLDRILTSPQFRASRRCSAFLRLVVEASAEGRADTIKERTLGVAIFERQPDYDTNQDPIVRNTAGQVRKRLAQYYYAPGHEAELRIDLPPGSYVPEFTRPAAPSNGASPEAGVEPVAAPIPELSAASPADAAGKRLRFGWLIAAAIAAGAIASFSLWYGSRKSVVEQFWEPLTGAPGPVTICVGQGHTYKLTPEWDRYFDAPDATS